MSSEGNFIPKVTVKPILVSAGSALSATIATKGMSLVGVSTPSGFQGTVAYLQGSDDGENFEDYYNVSGTRLSIAIAESRRILITPSDLVADNYLRLVFDSTQSVDREIRALLRAI